MTLARGARIAMAGTLALCACALVFVAIEAWRVPGEMRSRDASLLGPREGNAAWPTSAGPVLALIGAQDDVSYRHAIALFLHARSLLDPTATRSSAAIVAAVESGVVFARIEKGGLDARRRSEVSNLDAVLIGQGNELDGDSLELERAAVLLQSAIRLDRSDLEAEANLERLLDRQGSNIGTRRATETGAPGDKPGASPANQGY